MNPESRYIPFDLNKNRAHRKPLGFTLVELLVVVSIIGILASLVFPLGKSMIEKGNSTKCINNLRQIGGAIGQFMTENDGYLPCSAGYKYGATSGANSFA